jgi:arylformamidase
VTLLDISILTGATTPEWPGDTPFSCGWASRLSEGATVNLTSITTSPHVGTHADAPLHVRDGAGASDSLPMDAFVGDVLVVSVSETPRDVGAEELLDRIPVGIVRVLLRTGRSIADGTFPDDWPALHPSAARALVTRGVRLLGVDAPSVDRRHSTTLAVHHELFDGGAVILENLDLRHVADGTYGLIALPLRWKGLDAAPVRAVLQVPARNAAGR